MMVVLHGIFAKKGKEREREGQRRVLFCPQGKDVTNRFEIKVSRGVAERE